MQIDVRTLLNRLDPECRTAMEGAAALCVRETQYTVEIEHLLLQLLRADSAELLAILMRFDVKRQQVESQLQQAIDRFNRGNGRTPALASVFERVFQEAWMIASMLLKAPQIRAGALVLAVLETDSVRAAMLESAPSLLKISRRRLREHLQACDESGAQRAAAEIGVTPSLDRFTVDLTQLAAAGKIDPICGRDAEIRQLIDVLLRRRQNNPILTGEAGVGKTAVVEGLAQRIAKQRVPPGLSDVSIRSLDLALLQAGAGVRGEFEHRLKSVIAEVRQSKVPIILFIDEAHQLIGAGGAEGQGDAANLLKPALARGELRTIAATTWAEYKRHFERDPALVRRFQRIRIDEPSEAVAIDMLRAMVPKFEQHHEIEVLDEAVRDAVRLAQRYITGRQLPDKAISVLDTACARAALRRESVPSDIEALERVIASHEHQLRLQRRMRATGVACTDAVRSVTQQLADAHFAHHRLTERFAAELRIVDDIVALRREIAAALDADSADADAADSACCARERLTRLRRLEQALDALQDGKPMVSPCVDAATVAAVISDWTGVPVGHMLAGELQKVRQLPDLLAARVKGQDAALDVICRRIRTARAGLDDPGKPVGVFLLVGPSGVGKTETALALADTLYGGERHLITVNLSEFQEAHSVSGLKGAPPGYVGYGRGGTLTEAVRRRPYSVVLLDEIEKAHPDVLDMFFQVFDKGTMEDGDGVTIDFRHTVILLTSNAAQHVIVDACKNGVEDDDGDGDNHDNGASCRPALGMALNTALHTALLTRFSPAFLGRLLLVPYCPLSDKRIREIVELKLDRLAERVRREHRARFHWSDDVTPAIAAQCKQTDGGARTIDHLLTQSVLPAMSAQVLDHIAVGTPFDTVAMSIGANDDFLFQFSHEGGA